MNENFEFREANEEDILIDGTKEKNPVIILKDKDDVIKYNAVEVSKIERTRDLAGWKITLENGKIIERGGNEITIKKGDEICPVVTFRDRDDNGKFDLCSLDEIEKIYYNDKNDTIMVYFVGGLFPHKGISEYNLTVINFT